MTLCICDVENMWCQEVDARKFGSVHRWYVVEIKNEMYGKFVALIERKCPSRQRGKMKKFHQSLLRMTKVKRAPNYC